MNTQALDLFIIDDNPMVTKGLRNYLNNRFGKSINIFTFATGKEALKKIDKNTRIVILDYFLEDENGNDVLKSIKEINAHTEVIMLSRNEDVGVAIEALRIGATSYVVKGETAWTKVSKLIYTIITYPIKILVNEFGVNKFCAIFLLTFVTMGIIVVLTLRYFNWNTLGFLIR